VAHRPVQVLRALGDLALANLDAAHGRWRLADSRMLGNDTFEAYERSRCSPE
jgi:diaminohydroxyphosphoribosylaminopyrimidine deaminase/5-amino-6-(5-phosphoribosylamino)uracil reductase